MSFTEFCCRSGGSNLNAGTVDGSSTEPATASLVTYTGGDWNATTDVYTAPVGADMTEAVVGRFASLYHDGDTSPTSNQFLVARITAVNAGTRQITLSTTARALLGTEVATGTGNRSMRIGGAWAGPSGTSGFPLTFATSSLTNSSSNKPRINLKNDQTYSMTSSITVASANAGIAVGGYTSSFGDGGLAVVDGGTSTDLLFTIAGSGVWMHHLKVSTSFATGAANPLFTVTSGTGFVGYRMVFTGGRLSGFNSNSDCVMVECEAFGNNVANSANRGGFANSSDALFIRCISHDNAGSNSAGFYSNGTSAQYVNCIADTNGGIGFRCNASRSVSIKECVAYNNGSHGIELIAGCHVENCILTKNGGYGITCTADNLFQLVLNCAFGAGTQANTSGQTNNSAAWVTSGAITLDTDVSPFVDAPNGDFRITLSTAKGAGRGTFTQTASSYSGTVGYPDIGAAQAAASGGGARMVNIRGGADQ